MAAPQVQSITCPSCGGTVTLRGYGQSLNAVCVQCLSILDARNENVRVLQQFQAAERIRPAIPLGTRGQLGNTKWEAIGFQVRETEVDEVTYSWREFVLFNPYQGFRYLSEYDGHWNVIRMAAGVPEELAAGRRPTVRYQNKLYRHFQTSVARTAYVMGEFPWQVRVGETVKVADYIKPPAMLSAEITENEVTWSMGEYAEPEAIWKAFALPGQPPPKVGVFADQPAPAGQADGVSSIWHAWKWLTLALVVVAFVLYFAAGHNEVFHQSYSFATGQAGASGQAVTSDLADAGDQAGASASGQAGAAASGAQAGASGSQAGASGQAGAASQAGAGSQAGASASGAQASGDQGLVTPQFEVKGGSSNLEIEIRTNLDNDWAYFNIALIDVQGGQAREFGREVSYYSGSDSDGSWTEGDRRDEVSVLNVAAGKYYLRIDPEMETTGRHAVQYEVIVRRDVPTLSFFWLALLLLLIPPAARSIKGAGFETARWRQSDYAS